MALRINWLLEPAEKVENLQKQLSAKITFINNGWEEERYSLQDKVERYEKALNEIARWDKMLYSARELGNFAIRELGLPITPLSD